MEGIPTETDFTRKLQGLSNLGNCLGNMQGIPVETDFPQKIFGTKSIEKFVRFFGQEILNGFQPEHVSL